MDAFRLNTAVPILNTFADEGPHPFLPSEVQDAIEDMNNGAQPGIPFGRAFRAEGHSLPVILAPTFYTRCMPATFLLYQDCSCTYIKDTGWSPACGAG